MSHNIAVFISHSWTYSEHYERLHAWIFERMWNVDQKTLVFHDTSVPRDDPIHDAPTTHALEDAIVRRIIVSDVVVVPTGMYSNYSTWIGKEIKGAKKENKPILGINPWGQKRRSSVVTDAASEVVGWNAQSAVQGIWRLCGRS